MKLHNVRFFLLPFSILLLLSLTGCWSSKEIENRGFTAGIAMDKGQESALEKRLRKQGGGYRKKNLLTSTYQFINPQSTGMKNKEGNSPSKSYINISETGDSIHQMTGELSLRTNRSMFSPHLKVIVISADLARTYSLHQLLDQYLRDNEIRLSCLVLISKGQASKTLTLKEVDEMPAFRLLEIVNNRSKTTRILPPMSLAKLVGKMQAGTSFLLQNVISANEEEKFAGAAIIEGKTKKLRGFLNEMELDGLTWLTGAGKGGVVKSFDNKTGQPIVYEIKSMKSKITPHIAKNNISFDVKIESEGRLSESWVTSGTSSENKSLKMKEEIFEKEVSRLVKQTLKKIQIEYRTDVAGFGNQLRIEHPRVWEKIKKDWDKRFSKVPIKYSVKLTITDYGE
ncbi:Ger(x)C family spore germination protein [Ectobacillus funiculus]|uniref:Ger(x)C family spore germination protein n=1 Tax=Ectobacillus funiculus TaxID=137993 RepID=UPI003977F7F7